MQLVVSGRKVNETNVWFKMRLTRFTLRFINIAIKIKNHSIKLRRRDLLPIFDTVRDYVEKNGEWLVAEIDDGKGEIVEVKIQK